MAQDFPPASDQGYPQEGGGPAPVGYDYQQTWYPTEQQPYGTQQQPYPGEQPYPAEPYPGDQQAGGQYVGDQYSGDQYPAGQYLGEQYPAEQHSGESQPWQWPEQQYQAAAHTDPFATATMPPVAADPSADPSGDPHGDLHGDPSPDPAADPSAEPDSAADVDPTVAPVPAPRSRRGSGGAGSGQGSPLDRARSAARGALGAVLATEGAPSRRTLAIRVAAGVAALGVLVTAGVVATSGSGTHHAAPAGPPVADPGFAVAHNRIWAAQPAAAPPAGTDDTLIGSWLLPTALVRADGSGVHAYDLATGKPTWNLDAPAAGATPCDLSPTVNSAGIGGVLFHTQADPKSPCALLAAVDTKAGKVAWTKPLSGNNPYSAQVAVTEDKVIAVGDDKVSAWSAANGQDAWQYGGQGKYCTLSGSASGATVLVHSSCVDSSPGDQAVALGAADGKPLWAKGLPSQPKTATVLSAEPAVMLTTGDQPTDDKLLAWGQNGDPAVAIPVTDPNGGGELNVGQGSFDALPGAFFQDHMLVTTLAAPGGKTSVIAYDLGSGKQLWRTPVSEKGGVAAVGLDDGSLVLAAEERLDQPAHLSRFALASGQESVGGGFPHGTGSLLTSGRVLIGNDRVIAVPGHSATFGTASAYQAKG
ncbi:PQQ-binding-like beta-propeller repeat protein [Kitasatospora sp. NBC_01287]|uniref:outer membrane protein assembly factor BamB family protein n=1 Tax=Kitasatospora sp. NBC_01287 TaxID=2903573 RepID=UPI002259CA8D|nr:PQQ-binding-like beta-propeller repeat protein [Kitasatospora sp. NBC_01287]MCX4746027.1 PQQ-binding-like beta-propeller repeat protein [Kitasatospora sp. NBC_01287]